MIKQVKSYAFSVQVVNVEACSLRTTVRSSASSYLLGPWSCPKMVAVFLYLSAIEPSLDFHVISPHFTIWPRILISLCSQYSHLLWKYLDTSRKWLSCRLRTNVIACIGPITFAFACNLLQLVRFSHRQDVRAATVVFFLELQKAEVRQLNHPARVY